VWSTTTGKLVTTLTMPNQGQAVAIAFSADDKTLLAGDVASSRLYRLDLATGQATNLRAVPSSSAWTTSGDGSTLAVVSSGGTIDVTNMDSGAAIAQLTSPVTGTIASDSLALDSTGQTLIISDTSGDAYVMDVQSGQVTDTVHYDYKGSNSATPLISPDGKSVYVPSAGTGPGGIWDVASMSSITPHDARWPQVSAGALYSSDGTVVTTFPQSGTTNTFWDVATGSYITTVNIPGSQHYTELDLGPGGHTLLLGDPDNSQASDFSKFYLWDNV
jgi:WD40 repeat protein